MSKSSGSDDDDDDDDDDDTTVIVVVVCWWCIALLRAMDSSFGLIQFDGFELNRIPLIAEFKQLVCKWNPIVDVFRTSHIDVKFSEARGV